MEWQKIKLFSENYQQVYYNNRKYAVLLNCYMLNNANGSFVVKTLIWVQGSSKLLLVNLMHNSSKLSPQIV